MGSLKQNSQPKPQYNQQSENHMSEKLIIFGIQENQDQFSRIEAMNTDKKPSSIYFRANNGSERCRNS